MGTLLFYWPSSLQPASCHAGNDLKSKGISLQQQVKPDIPGSQ
jgi:hypothetical protein